MGQITVSAKTLDEAITKALIELQTTSEHLHYDVIQSATNGIFGLFGGKPCVIRARVMSEEEEGAKKKEAERKKKEEARRIEEEKKAALRKAREAEIAEKEKAEKQAAAFKAPEEKKISPVKPLAESEPTQAIPAEQKEQKENPSGSISQDSVVAEEKPSEKPYRDKYSERFAGEKKNGGRDSRYGNRAERREYPKKDYQKKEAQKGYSNQKRESSRRDAAARREEEALREQKQKEIAAEKEARRIAVQVDEEAVKKSAKDFLDQVFGAMGMEVEVEPVFDPVEKELQVFLSGDAMGILIGKRGQTLDSLQYLVSLVVNKETEGYLRVKLDTENYRQRRKETLETLAKNISYKVKRTKHPVSLEPMNPYERRIIHAALQNDRYVVTRSEGEDPYRHVVISLKRDNYGGGNSRRDHYSSRKEKGFRQNRYNPKKTEREENEEPQMKRESSGPEVAEPYSIDDVE